MKSLIKNLLMPFAILAMLTVGAFTINASEKTDHAVNIESITEFQVADPYDGDYYIEILDPITGKYVFTKVIPTSEGTCTLTVLDVRCTYIIGTMVYDLWGESPLGGYAPLYEL
jgi:hypothetical protein